MITILLIDQNNIALDPNYCFYNQIAFLKKEYFKLCHLIEKNKKIKLESKFHSIQNKVYYLYRNMINKGKDYQVQFGYQVNLYNVKTLNSLILYSHWRYCKISLPKLAISQGKYIPNYVVYVEKHEQEILSNTAKLFKKNFIHSKRGGGEP